MRRNNGLCKAALVCRFSVVCKIHCGSSEQRLLSAFRENITSKTKKHLEGKFFCTFFERHPISSLTAAHGNEKTFRL